MVAWVKETTAGRAHVWGGRVPCPLEPQRLRVKKCKTQGRPGLAGAACGPKPGKAPWEGSSPSPPALGGEQARTRCCGLQHVF